MKAKKEHICLKGLVILSFHVSIIGGSLAMQKPNFDLRRHTTS
jgi:hypothetical protein